MSTRKTLLALPLLALLAGCGPGPEVAPSAPNRDVLRRLDTLERENRALRARMDALREPVEGMGLTDLRGVAARVQSLEGRVGTLDHRLTLIEGR